MKYFTILLAFLSTILFACAEKTALSPQTLIGEKDAKIDYITGECLDMKDRPLMKPVTITFSREDKKLAEIWLCKNGKLDGAAKSFHENGNLSSETLYQDGNIIGVKKRYYEGGELLSETPFFSNKEEGVEKTYYESGKIKTEVPYQAGAVVGAIKGFYENGNLQFEILAKSEGAKQMSEEKVYFEDGELQQETFCEGAFAENCVTKSYPADGKSTPVVTKHKKSPE